MQRLRKNLAFTLAEVLITLGIIGIVAAMVIPSLIAKTQEIIINNQFKKSYALLKNALKLIEEEGYYCKYVAKGAFNIYSGSQCKEFYESIPKYIRTSSICHGEAYENGCIPNYSGEKLSKLKSGGCGGFTISNILNKNTAYVFAGDTILIPYGANQTYPIFIMDVNGKKGPNKMGYDAFIFYLRDDMEKGGYKLSAPNGGCVVVEEGGRSGDEMIKLLINK